MNAFITSFPTLLSRPYATGTPTRYPRRLPTHPRSPFPARIHPSCATESPDTPATESPDTPTTESPSSPATTTDTPSTSPETPPEPPFELRGFSLANVFLGAGMVVIITSFTSYINSSGTASATSLGFVYGVPILLIGCALKYAELQPVRVETTPDAAAARETKATEVQQKIYKDITRHRYGDEAHLSAALASLGLVPRGEACPVLESGKESVVGGEYCLELVFTSAVTPYREWTGKIDKFERFFGPNVKAEVEKLDAQKRLVALRLTSC